MAGQCSAVAGRRVRRCALSTRAAVCRGQEGRAPGNAPRAGSRRTGARERAPPNAFFDVLDEALAQHVGDEAAGFVRMVFSLSAPATIELISGTRGSTTPPCAPTASRCGCRSRATFSGSTCTARRLRECCRTSTQPASPPWSRRSSGGGFAAADRQRILGALREGVSRAEAALAVASRRPLIEPRGYDGSVAEATACPRHSASSRP
jgi:hypothetical protein